MPIKDFEDKRLEDQNKEIESNSLTAGQNINRPDKKLLLGTVQFYEDILTSINKSFIVVFNNHGKHIEVWGNANFKEDYGIALSDFKGKLLQDIYPEELAQDLLLKINEVFESGKSNLTNFDVEFPKGSFRMEVTFSPLSSDNDFPTTVIANFRDVTDKTRYEKELSLAKEKYRNLVELSPEGIITTNIKGVITSANLAFKEFSGYSDAAIVGKKITKLPNLNPLSVSRFQANIDYILDNQSTQAFELSWEKDEGIVSWFEVHISAIKKKNRLVGLQVLFNNITERKQIESDLLKSKQAYKVIIENAHEAIFILQDNQIRFCNSKLIEMVNTSMDELLHQSFSDLIHPLDQVATEQKFNNSLAVKSSINDFTFRIIDKNGNVKWLLNNAVSIDWGGKPAILSFATDITHKKSDDDKKQKHIQSLEFLSEKALEFVELKPNDDVYRFLGEKIGEISKDALVWLVSYNQESQFTATQHIEGPEGKQERFVQIISNATDQFRLKLNHDLIRNLSFGNLIKLNDGLFELGYNIFPKNSFTLIQENLHVGDIYLIGLTWENKVFGNVIIFLPENQKLENPDAIETLVKLSSFSLHRKDSEEELKKRVKKYRRIFESHQDVYYRADIDGTILEVSPSVKEFGGYSTEEIEGKSINDFIPNKSIIRRLSKRLLRDGILSDIDIQLQNKDDKKIDASLNVKLLINEKNKIIGSEGVIRDISKRKKEESYFKDSEEKLRTLADFTYDWEYWLAPDNSIIYISPSCERISGYAPQAFSNNPKLLIDIVHPDDKHLFEDFTRKGNVEIEETKNFDFRIISKEKTTKWINHVYRKVYDTNDKYLGIRASNRDITERKIAEENLRLSEERFRALFHDSPDAVFVQNFDGIVLDVNPAGCKLHMMEKEDIVGKNVIDLVPDEHKDTVAEEFPKWLTGEITTQLGFSETSTGLSVPVQINGSKFHYSGKEGLLFLVRDITKMKETEDKLRKSVQKAEESDMLKSVFLANMSHEIRTPMNAIIGFSEILSDQDLSKKERQEFINYITQGSNTLMNLIEDIIDITKIEAGQIKINFEECDVNNLMDELYATFIKMKNMNGKQNLELRLNKPVVKEGFTINTDPSRIRQILSNLIVNALKFTNDGYIEFGFTISGENQIIFYVKDTGVGIPEDKKKVIFERFGQVEHHLKQNKKGTGLGLSISKKLSDLLGGDLAVESEVDKGSIFFLTLPIIRDYKKEFVTKEVIPTTPLYDWKNKTFLIAEDSILNYTFLEALFQKTKVNLIWAKDGKQAVDFCRENDEIDLVLMDIKMPILSGLEAITEIKKFRKELPIIVQTAYAMPEDRDRSFEAGGDEHLTKPLNVDELFKTITKFLD